MGKFARWIIVEESMSAAESSLRRAELLVCHAAQQLTSTERRTKLEDAISSASLDSPLLGTALGKLDRLENTLRPADHLSGIPDP